ncbi:MAG: MYXO-CTERM sorting domain-containing protein [Phycisphaerales bacterium]
MSLVGAPATVDSTGGAEFSVDVIGDASVGTHMGGGGFYLTSGSDPMIENISWTPAPWNSFADDGGYAGNGDYNLVVFGQIIPPFHSEPEPGSELGSSIGTFHITIADGASGQLDLGFVEDHDLPFSLEVWEWEPGDGNTSGRIAEAFHDTEGQLSLNGASVTVVPTGPSLAVLGLGGGLLSRRRR